MFPFFSKKHTMISSIAIIDSQFPQKKPFGFRNFEINGILEKVKGSKVYSMFPIKPGKKSWFKHGYGINKNNFEENVNGYLTYYPENIKRVEYLPQKITKPFLAYTYFLAETYTLLPYLEKNKLPFIFVLYPGGAFGLNNNSSDEMLKQIFKSKYFRKVIVTQRVTRNYLLENKLCSENDIHYEYGGYVQFNENEIPIKLEYLKNKNTIDICFVAAKYSDKGVDKGYDLFVGVAKYLVKKYSFVHFHVVGGFDANEIDVTELKDTITFYGYKNKDFLLDFYPRMDIFLSPNRPFMLFEGNFDGFPLGLDAMCFGNVLMVTDELNNNELFNDREELIIIKPELDDILKKIEWLIETPTELQKIGNAGKKKLYQELDPDVRLQHIVSVLNKEYACIINEEKSI